MYHRIRPPLFCLPLIFYGNAAYPVEIDITDNIVEIMECNATNYQSRTDSDVDFDREAFDWAWDKCEGTRESLLQAIPTHMRPEWESKLEIMRSSMIDRFNPDQPSQPGYGLNPGEPVLVGGVDDGPRRSYEYFSRLRSLDGTPVRVKRIGSCCRFKTSNAQVGEHGALDKYAVTYDGSKSIVTVYVNIYDEGATLPVEGFKLEDGT